MPPLPSKDVVNAVVESTREYLRFLNEQSLGRSKYRATSIRMVEGQDTFFDNSRWQIYSCRIPPHSSIRPDTSATFVSHVQPGTETEICIVTYNRRNGQATIAVREPVAGEVGDIIIDFRWLVRRCLEWFQNRGTSVDEIEKIAASAPNQVVPFVQPPDQSPEQFQAVQTILTSGLSYIWGPPGTGKTTWVLAKAVRYCAEQIERILVLASTNLAVDNALTAILREGVAKENVLRIGIPSDGFRDEFPECCEERAFREKTEKIAREIRKQEHAITSVELCVLQDQVGPAEKKLQEAESIQESLQQELNQLKNRQQLLKTELEELAFPQLVKEVKALEAEQTQTIMRRADLQKQLKGLGWLERLFTKRKRTLTDAIAKEQWHLEAVESTLLSKRRKRGVLAPRVADLEASIAQLRSQETGVGQNLTQQQRQTGDLATRHHQLRDAIAEKRSLLRQSENAIGDLAAMPLRFYS